MIQYLNKIFVTTCIARSYLERVKQQKTLFFMESPSSSCSHRRNMLVADSKPLNETSLIVGAICNSKSVAAKRMVRTIWNGTGK